LKSGGPGVSRTRDL